MTSLSTLESDCIKKLAKLFHEGKDFWTDDLGLESIGLNEGNRGPVLGLLASMSIIAEVGHVSEAPFCHFRITPKVIIVERELREQEEKPKEGEDRVESIKKYLRRNWFAASIIAMILGVTVLATCVNQVLGVVEKLGYLEKPKEKQER